MPGSGFNDTGDGIYVETNYGYDIELEIYGGVISAYDTADGALALRVYEEDAENVSVKVYGGEFNTGINPDYMVEPEPSEPVEDEPAEENPPADDEQSSEEPEDSTNTEGDATEGGTDTQPSEGDNSEGTDQSGGEALEGGDTGTEENTNTDEGGEPAA